MALVAYRAKRRFSQSPEPEGTLKPGRGPLSFVVQKHQASRLHFDLRLELNGVLKSWAVPKGPSLESHQKRLAIQVEDHPLDYLHFEGTIPKGNYGGGTVMVWDTGTYHAPGATSRAESARIAKEGLETGHLEFVLHGKKLNGKFALIRTDRPKPGSWLLFGKDAGGADCELETMDWSAISGRTLDEISRGSVPRPREHTLPGVNLTDVPRKSMPRKVQPMLATPVAEPFDDPEWIFEVKWDGYRAIAEIEPAGVKLYSRNYQSFKERFRAIVDSLEHLGHEAVLDGEVVVLDHKGKSSFSLLQHYRDSRAGNLVYQVFDLLYLDGHDLRKLPLVRRKDILANLFCNLPNVKCSEHIQEQGKAFYQAAADHGLEGIVAKKLNSRYQEGIRSQSWLKIKTQIRQEAIICGFTEPKGSRKGLGSLVLGMYEEDSLVFIGQAGSGFSVKGLTELRKRLDVSTQKVCPFKTRPKTTGRAHWVVPQLVCEVSFANWTKDNRMWHPVFLGLREDKSADVVHQEVPMKESSLAKPTARAKPAGKQATSTLKRPSTTTDQPHLTNLDKVYWPKEGFTKGNLIGFYREIASVILPYLVDRPQSLNRFPNGIEGKSFFQKDVSRQPPPSWVQTVELTSEEDNKTLQTILCQDAPTLLYLANLGCIELNPWHARVKSLDRPDYAILDLDPEDISFEKVIEVAQAIRKVLEAVGAVGLCKTSGKRGLHVYVPLGAKYTHEQTKLFAELIARIVHATLPASTSLVRSPKGRQGRVYLDYLQNGKGKTVAAPYSVRPYPGATVSTPLQWSEVRRGLDPAKFTIKALDRRLGTVGDLWQPTLGRGIDLESCMNRVAKLLQSKST